MIVERIMKLEEADIVINGVTLTKDQSAAVRRACTAFLMMLNDKKFSEALGFKAVLDREHVGAVLNIINME
jgi:hypothetical protein